MNISFRDLRLDDTGRVVLDDDDLKEVEALGAVMSGGGDGQINSGQCLNSASCANSTNGQCTNTQNACNHASNTKCMDTDPKPDEVLP